MNYQFKVTIKSILVYLLFLGGSAYAQNIIPIKLNDSWAYKNESSEVLVYQNLENAEPFRGGLGFAKKNGKWGALDESMNETIPFDFDAIELIVPNIIRVLNGRTYDLYNGKGKKLYSNLSSAVECKLIENSVVLSNNSGEFGLISSNNEIIVPLKYSSPPVAQTGDDMSFFLAKKDKFYQGILNSKGETVVPFKYMFVKPYGEDLYSCQKEDRTFDFYRRNGKFIYTSKTRSVQFVDSIYVIERGEIETKITLLAKNKVVKHKDYRVVERILFCHDSLQTTFYFPNGKSIKKSGQWRINEKRDDYLLVGETIGSKTLFGLWDMDSKEILPAKYSSILSWSHKWAVVTDNTSPRKQVLVDLKTGKIANVYDRVELLSCDNVRVLKDGVSQLLNKNLKELSESNLGEKSVYYTIGEDDIKNLRREYNYETKRSLDEKFDENEDCKARDLQDVKLSNVRLIKDKYGKNPIPNRILVTTFIGDKRQTGIINFEGKVIVPCQYASIGLHHNGLIEFGKSENLDVGSKARLGLMDKNGNIILLAKYDQINDVKGDTAIVVLHGRFDLINVRTNEQILVGYDHIRFLAGGFTITKNGKTGFADRTGRIVVPVLYDKVFLNDKNLFEVERDKKKYYVDSNGNEYIRE